MNVRSLYAAVRVDDSAVVGEHCVLGYPKEDRIRGEQLKPGSVLVGEPVAIGARCVIGNHVVIHEGVRVSNDCVIDDRVRVGYNSSIGDRTRIAYGAYLCDRVSIGEDACVAGFVCDGTRIGDRSTVMGELVHEYSQPHKGWWEVDEEPPVIDVDSVVGYGARVVGAVRIGPRSYVAAGAVVTKDVPPEHVATGVNVHTPADRWTGRKLQDLLRHWMSARGR
ncbi:DapH/DapD/GlmU-related protein [Labedaea rhizosphaerae]|uniref:Transferase family hexapeptide repeat protein n=1 Tax=Labedaea rhizosphaerae TaxID=598644 RepID=A0A4R6SG37_LABRH|nr:DapH/DapD/GlmU-related protein [Labedaea rhizosphaerae]TDQ00645.1 transferase family hexapeptide repeat protein [Labedaea rhizosphaerae]